MPLRYLLFQLLPDHLDCIGRDEQVGLVEVLDDKVLVLVHCEYELLDWWVAASYGGMNGSGLFISLLATRVPIALVQLSKATTYVVMRAPATSGVSEEEEEAILQSVSTELVD